MALIPLLSLPGVGILLVVYYTVSSAAAWYRLRHFRGPFPGCLSYFLIIKPDRAARCWEAYTSISPKFGPLAGIGLNELITNDPELIRNMSSTRSTYVRSRWYGAARLYPYDDIMASLRDTTAHDRLKAKTASGYAGRENPDFKLASTPSSRAWSTISAENMSRATASFGPWTARAWRNSDSDVFEHIRTTEVIVPQIQLQADAPWFQKLQLNQLVLKSTGPKARDKAGIGRLMAGIAAKRFEPKAGIYRRNRQQQAVIYEGLRFHSPFAALLLKQVPPEGDTYQGKFTLGGTCFGHSTWSVMRNKQIFGDDVELFRPEMAQYRPSRACNHGENCRVCFLLREMGMRLLVTFMELNKFYVEVRS
ncbi:hypothetical protein DL767_005366 [Monosporascus sp. MG133]|nr:hypothetical protein DL767_005366 [Monosporascus sp. MG133]